MRVSALSESNAFRCIRYGPLQTIASIAGRSIKAHTYFYLCSIARWVFHSYLPVSPADFCEYPGFIHSANFAFDYNVPTLQRALYWKVTMGSKGITRVAGPLYVAGL